MILLCNCVWYCVHLFTSELFDVIGSFVSFKNLSSTSFCHSAKMEQLLENVHEPGRCCIAIHPASKHMTIAGWNGLIKQYAYGLSSQSLSLSNPMDDSSQYHDDPIHEIAYCSSGDYFAICCEDGECVLFRHARCSVHSMLCKFDNPVSSISFLPEPHSFLFAMSSDHGVIKMVNAINCTQKYFEFQCCKDGVRHIKFIGHKPDSLRVSWLNATVHSQFGKYSKWHCLMTQRRKLVKKS